MYLKSLELHGFKSFPDRTVLKFNSGATIIVGPNGSGKSNITDAMRWVLGELSSKNIRGSKMEDVIFAGADAKKPMSFAEVSVTFDDSAEPHVLASPYDEVTVTRRYYRSGDSEYFINRKKVRLRDIYELFMNTGIGREGYSIIGQGKIAEIISKKSDERRGVFEESAGISKYRYKKTESEKKLAETESNMERVEDIENELSNRLIPLEKDASRARQYLELYGEKKKIDISLWLYDSDKLKNALEKAENDTKLSAHELEMAEDSINITSAKIERLYEESHNNKEASQKNHEETTAVTRQMTDAKAEILVLAKEKEHTESKILSEHTLCEASDKSIIRESERLAAAEDNFRKIVSEFNKSRDEFEALTDTIAELDLTVRSYTAELDELLAKQRSAEASLTDLRVRLNVQESNIASQKKRTEAVSAEITKYADELALLDKTAYAAENQIEEYRKIVAKIDEEVAEYRQTADKMRNEAAGIETHARQKQSELDSLESRISALERMRDHFDGYNNSIKHIMNESRSGRLSGIRGPVSYLIKVEPKYTVAIETSLGASLQNIVTDNEEAAKRSIESLKRSNAGRATFYPLTTIRAQERGRECDGVDSMHGFVGWADELVSRENEYDGVIKSLLARTAVFDNLDNATDAARKKNWRIRAVTLDGQQINAGGSFTGGQTKRDSGILSRASQIESLTAERDKTAAEVNDIKLDLKEISRKISAFDTQISSADDRQRLINSLIGAEQKNYSETDGRRIAIRNLIESLKKDMAALIEGSAHSSDELNKIRDDITLLTETIEKTKSMRDEKAAHRGENELQISGYTEQLNECKIRLAELSRDREAADSLMNDTKERISEMTLERDSHKNSIIELEKLIIRYSEQSESKKRVILEYSQKLAELAECRAKLDLSGDSIELQITTLRQTEKEQSAKKELVFIAHSKNETKLASLKSDADKMTAHLWDEYELTYATAKKYAQENDCRAVTDGERSSFQSAQNELRAKIKSLGHVNVEAIAEYNEVRTRYDYIKTQLDDLRASREDLLNILVEIESDMKRIFLEAFEQINRYFGEVFCELFGGGHAEVKLAEPDDILNSGIEINAAPPGKTIKNLNLLSGGEQAFIAIALMFALIRVNPSPFCIFDEIEAALDEVNVTRVGRYISKISKEMQVIMISHRRGTMDIADTIYGVTMQQSGVSKIFTLSAIE